VLPCAFASTMPNAFEITHALDFCAYAFWLLKAIKYLLKHAVGGV